MPFVARWPGRIKPGTTSDHLTCLTDLIATAAEITGAKLPDNAGEDSISMLPALLGTNAAPARQDAIHHSVHGNFSIRQGNWKLELCAGSGGWSAPKEPEAKKAGLPKVQLYDLSTDISERQNVQDKHPEIVDKLTRLLEKYAAEGRSTPGAPQANEGLVSIWGLAPGNQNTE
jgi:arylsulfatase A-like enzyme